MISRMPQKRGTPRPAQRSPVEVCVLKVAEVLDRRGRRHYHSAVGVVLQGLSEFLQGVASSGDDSPQGSP